MVMLELITAFISINPQFSILVIPYLILIIVMIFTLTLVAAFFIEAIYYLTKEMMNR